MLNRIYAPLSLPKLIHYIVVTVWSALQHLVHLLLIALNKCDDSLTVVLRNVFGLVLWVRPDGLLLHYWLLYF